MGVTHDQRSECERLLEGGIVGLAAEDVRAVGLVGSWARGEARMASDLDLVVLTNAVSEYGSDEGWVRDALGQPATMVRTERWGRLVERRARVGSGFEVEFGFADPSWASTDPF